MFSPAEYLTNLRQIALLNRIFIPPVNLPAAAQVPTAATSQIPVIATVPGISSTETSNQCSDFIAHLITTNNIQQLTLSAAATVITTLVIIYYIKKHGKNILSWFKQNYQMLLTSIKRKLLKQPVYLLPSPTAVAFS